MNRQEILQSLLKFNRPIAEIADSLTGFPWDSDPVIECRAQHVVAVLRRFEEDLLSAAEVENWANLIESREDVEMNKPVQEVIFELANPRINEALTLERAAEMCARLL